jgi:starch phosphorylase
MTPTPAVSTPRQVLPYDTLGMDADALKRSILAHLEFTLAELPKHVDSIWEPYVAVALAVRDRMVQRWVRTQDAYQEQDARGPGGARRMSPFCWRR